MASRALITWQNDRTARLDRLEAAHASLDGTGPGARKLTEELNHALVLRLATEFRGFVRTAPTVLPGGWSTLVP